MSERKVPLRRLLGVVASAAIAVTVLGACSEPVTQDEELVLRIANGFGPGGFDPIASVNETLVYDVLITRRDIDTVEPWLATSFEYDDSRTVLTFELRDDVDFIDGSHFDADVAKKNIDLHRSPEGVNAPQFSAIEEVVIVDEYTIELRLSRPDADLLSWLSRKGIASGEALEDRESLAITPVGSGPYILETAQGDSKYTFVRNDDYWNPDAFPFDRVEYTVMPDVTARVNALVSGQVDFVAIDQSTVAEMESAGKEIYSYSNAWIGLNLGDRRGELHPALADIRVRQAISMALDRVGFASTIALGDPSNQIGVEGQDGYYLPELADMYAYDVEGAKELLSDAGYPDGFDITMPNTQGYTSQYQPYFDQALSDIGIRVEWIDVADETWIEAYWGGVNGAVYPVLPTVAFFADLGFVRPDGQWNPWHNTDPETVEFLAVYDSGTDAERLEAKSRLTEKILEEAWFAILGHVPQVWAYDPDLEIDADSGDAVRVENIHPR